MEEFILIIILSILISFGTSILTNFFIKYTKSPSKCIDSKPLNIENIFEKESQRLWEEYWRDWEEKWVKEHGAIPIVNDIPDRMSKKE